MNRTQAIATIKAYAADGNLGGAMRIFVEGRISRSVYDRAVRDGQAFGAFIAKRDAK